MPHTRLPCLCTWYAGFFSLLLAYFLADHGAHTVRGAMEQVQKLREKLLDCMKTVDDLEVGMFYYSLRFCSPISSIAFTFVESFSR